MTARGFSLGNVLGIPVRVHVSWAVIVVLFTFALAVGFGRSLPYLALSSRLALGLTASLLLFGSVLAHELSHAVVALRHGVGIRGITLFIFGGAAEMVDEPPDAAAELRIAIAGPLMSLGLGIGFGLLYRLGLGIVPVPFVELVSWLSLANFMLVAFNLIPGFPLDGGRVLRAVLWGVWGKLAPATRVAAGLGSLFGVSVIALGIAWILSVGNLIGGLWLVLIGFFLRTAAGASHQQLALRRALEGVSARDLMTPGVATARPGTSLAEIVDDLVLPQGISEIPVVENGHLVGMLCIPDIRARAEEEWGGLTAADVMARDAVGQAIAPDEEAIRVLVRLGGEDRLLPVVEDGLFLGVVTRAEVMRHLQLRLES